MAMTPHVRKFALTVHVSSSVGWLGAVAAFLALAVAGLSSQDAQIVRASYPPSSTIVLLIYMQTLSYLSGVAAETTLSSGDLGRLQTGSPVLHAGVGLLLLLVATTLSVYKPQGLTPYGWRKQVEQRKES
jgi:hypothetical protein